MLRKLLIWLGILPEPSRDNDITYYHYYCISAEEKKHREEELERNSEEEYEMCQYHIDHKRKG